MGDNEEVRDVDVEETEAPESAIAEAKGFSLGKLIEWILSNMITVIVAVVISVVVSFFIINAVTSKKSEEVYRTVKITPKPAPLAIFMLDDFRLNTADIDEPRFVRAKIILGYNGGNKQLQTELVERKVQLRDIVLRILNRKEKRDIDTEEGKERLKEEIKKEINNILVNGEIEEVYFDEFVIS
jgi:flagellar FliL protein